MLKRKSKGQEGPQEITVRYAAGRMIFEVGGQEFYLTEEAAGKIFGTSVGLEFERLHGQDEDFGGLRTLENFVRVQRLMRKGMNLDQVAKIFGVTQEKLRQFYGSEVARPRVESFDPNSIAVERERQGENEDFCLEVPPPRRMEDQKDPEPSRRFVHLQDVRNAQRTGKSDGQVADSLNLDRNDFRRWLDLNQRYLDLLP